MGMDNAEAIKRIKDHIIVHHIGVYPHIKIAEALNMAISALANDNNVGHKVEVVRCKDCQRNNMHGGDCNRIITMYKHDPILELNVAEYIKLDFCSYGERKDNG